MPDKHRMATHFFVNSGCILLTIGSFHTKLRDFVKLGLHVKVGTHKETSLCNLSPEEFTRRHWSQGLVPGLSSHEAFGGTSRRDLSLD